MASARRAATYPGTRVAVVEQGRLGGTCVNVGCVPKKIMYIAADMVHKTRTGGNLGERMHFDWAKLKARRDAYIMRLNQIYERQVIGLNNISRMPWLNIKVLARIGT
ncbi:hypothetical protein PsorP6_006103 [Peronosclerospora sorghi]|uniref:Uncharacterized protein n=1 Tax=Peronosclerospora sorghi TaxID=230839 RepID=A0ACC0W5S9_9STRA|nr:hypothetical protein PsorP6_006103 [Peronosclerospora sorghi]